MTAIQAKKIPAPAFEPGSFAAAPKFPALKFTTREAYTAYLGEAQAMLDGRAAYERSLGARAETLVQPGTCAPCLRPAVFTSATAGGDQLADGSRCPNWRAAMHCDCARGLNNRHRAALHFMQASGVLPWARLLLLGAPEAVDPHLAALAAETVNMRPYQPAAVAEGFHFAVSLDYLQFVPSLALALAGLQARLLAGGRLIATVPFDADAGPSRLMDMAGFGGRVPGEYRAAAHQFGWDLLDRLRAAGFREAAAYLYWSAELGYLGAANFIFCAVK